MLYVVLAVVLLWTVVPVAWMAISSLKNPADVLSRAAAGLLADVANYAGPSAAATASLTYVAAAFLAAGISTILATVLGSLAGYGLARSRWRGKRHLAFWIISTRMVPIAAVILPLYIGFTYLHLINSIWALVVAYLSFNLPFAIWIMNAFFADLPQGIEEAARVDGANRFQTFYESPYR